MPGKGNKGGKGKHGAGGKVPDDGKATHVVSRRGRPGRNVGRSVVEGAVGKKAIPVEGDIVWDSGLKVVNPPIRIDVPQSIVDVMRAIDSKVIGNVEFSIYVKADTSGISRIRISEEYYIPKQVVSGASVDYNDVPIDGFNAVIHKHPRGITTFSGTDDSYINQNFAVSILWCDGAFVDSTVNFDISAGVKLQLEGNVIIDNTKELPDVDVSNIEISAARICKQMRIPPSTALSSYAEEYGGYVPPVGVGEVFDDDDELDSDEVTRLREEMALCGMY